MFFFSFVCKAQKAVKRKRDSFAVNSSKRAEFTAVKKMDLNTKSDKREESKKVDDDFKLKQLKAAKSECSKQLARMRV